MNTTMNTTMKKLVNIKPGQVVEYHKSRDIIREWRSLRSGLVNTAYEMYLNGKVELVQKKTLNGFSYLAIGRLEQ